MVKMARICDICGREIGTYNSRYSLTYKTALYSREKDICPLCFEKLQEQFKEHKVKTEPQTMYYPQVDGITPTVITEDRDTQILDAWQVKLKAEQTERSE